MKQMRLESKRETVCASSGKEAVMLIGKVTGSVVSTRKSENLIGSKFMITKTNGRRAKTARRR